MTGWARVLGRCNARWSGRADVWLFGVLLCTTAGCLNLSVQSTTSDPGGSSGGSFGVSGFGAGGGEVECTPATSATPVFADQVLSSRVLFTRELYAWTTDEQWLKLRGDQLLFSAPAGVGAPFTQLGTLASPTVGELALAQRLRNTFKLGRYAWPEPWAIRMGSPGEDPGGQLVRIVLKPEAWLAVVMGGSLLVYDAEQHPVPMVDALARPEQIGAIYFDTAFDPVNGCHGEPVGQREFLLGNLAMVEEWSLGTQQMADRLAANIDQLGHFFDKTRGCPVTADVTTWAVSVICKAWQMEVAPGVASASGIEPSSPGVAGAGGAPSATPAAGGAGPIALDPAHFGGSSLDPTEEFAYEQALALPNANYLAAPAQIAIIIETLQGDLFEPDPLVVIPGSP